MIQHTPPQDPYLPGTGSDDNQLVVAVMSPCARSARSMFARDTQLNMRYGSTVGSHRPFLLHALLYDHCHPPSVSINVRDLG